MQPPLCKINNRTLVSRYVRKSKYYHMNMSVKQLKMLCRVQSELTTHLTLQFEQYLRKKKQIKYRDIKININKNNLDIISTIPELKKYIMKLFQDTKITLVNPPVKFIQNSRS